MTDMIPSKVYIGFQGENDVVQPDEFPSLDEAVTYVKGQIKENDEIRREKPETPRLVFWINDVFPNERRSQ